MENENEAGAARAHPNISGDPDGEMQQGRKMCACAQILEQRLNLSGS